MLDSLQGMRKHGFSLPDELLLGDELHALEPSLSPRVQAGFHLAEQWHVRPTTMTLELARRLRELGVEIHEGARVTGFATSNGTRARGADAAGRRRRRRVRARRRLVDDTARARRSASGSRCSRARATRS